jgi:hypothetical protein
MRLLSFFTQVEATLAVLRPEDATGWLRRVNHHTGEALAWNSRLGLSLQLRVSSVADDRHALLARWVGPGGRVLEERTFFCGFSPFEWQSAAETIAELAPQGALSDHTTHPASPLAAGA